MAEPQSDTLKTPPINCSTELGQESGYAVLQSPSPATQGCKHPTESEAMATSLPSHSFGAVFLNLVKNTFCNEMLVSF